MYIILSFNASHYIVVISSPWYPIRTCSTLYFCFGSTPAARALIACSLASAKSPREGNRNFFKSSNCCLSFSVGGYFASKWSAQNNPPRQNRKNKVELKSRVRRGIAVDSVWQLKRNLPSMRPTADFHRSAVVTVLNRVGPRRFDIMSNRRGRNAFLWR